MRIGSLPSRSSSLLVVIPQQVEFVQHALVNFYLLLWFERSFLLAVDSERRVDRCRQSWRFRLSWCGLRILSPRIRLHGQIIGRGGRIRYVEVAQRAGHHILVDNGGGSHRGCSRDGWARDVPISGLLHSKLFQFRSVLVSEFSSMMRTS